MRNIEFKQLPPDRHIFNQLPKLKLFDMFMYKALYFNWFEKIYLFLLGKCDDLLLEDRFNTPAY